MRYRKKPLEVDAWQWDGDDCSWLNAPEWLHVDHDKFGFHIETLEGNMYISPGDYIVRGTFGELYPCKPDIFESCYEEVL